MLDASEQSVVDDIERVGWHLIGIPKDEVGLSFVYSIGLMTTFEHPEVIIFGLALPVMFDIVNNIGRDIKSGRRFMEPVLYDGLIANYACKVAPVSRTFHKEYFGYAMWHRRHLGKIGTLEAVQCFWPDNSGAFPDEADCDPAISNLQPRLQ